jgi:hypothetical protein
VCARVHVKLVSLLGCCACARAESLGRSFSRMGACACSRCVWSRVQHGVWRMLVVLQELQRCLAHAGSSAGVAADGKAMAVASKSGGEHNNLAWEHNLAWEQS